MLLAAMVKDAQDFAFGASHIQPLLVSQLTAGPVCAHHEACGRLTQVLPNQARKSMTMMRLVE